MNYFTHGIDYIDRPYFLAGTCLPDWLSVVDRRIRLRPKKLDPWISGQADLCQPSIHSSQLLTEIAQGAMQHLTDDGWFHSSRGAVEVMADLTSLFRQALEPADGLRCSVLGHITTELLLDAVLIERNPGRIDQYFASLRQVDSRLVADAVALFCPPGAEQLAWFIDLFCREEVLRDYSDDERLWRRLNQIQTRIKLPLLPVSAIHVIQAGREVVRRRAQELLPENCFPHRYLKPLAIAS